MINKIKDLLIKYKEVISYLFFGGCTFFVNLIATFVLRDLLSMSTLVASIPAWVIAVLFAYVTNKLWVFESKAKGKEAFKEMMSFFAARLATLVLELVVIWVGTKMFGEGDLAQLIIKIVGQVLVILSNYVFSKLFIFKKN